MRKANLISGLAGMAGAMTGLMAMVPGTMPDTSFGLPAWFMPCVALGLVGTFSALLALKSLTRREAGEQPSAEYGRALALIPGLVLSGLGAAAVSFLGFVVGGPILILSLMLLIGERRKRRLLLVSIIPPVVLALFATHVLGVPLP